ncbi:hypothetical protein B0H14DRAFT_3431633 [Mycena olivaceomarginata]|nr:hypothetical protein B0H14DRAFT_3431633 [Mycena olivaceomarginata]
MEGEGVERTLCRCGQDYAQPRTGVADNDIGERVQNSHTVQRQRRTGTAENRQGREQGRWRTVATENRGDQEQVNGGPRRGEATELTPCVGAAENRAVEGRGSREQPPQPQRAGATEQAQLRTDERQMMEGEGAALTSCVGGQEQAPRPQRTETMENR